jgi:hypothetical protein
VSAELLAQKRAALGSPDSEQSAGTSDTEHSKAVSGGLTNPAGGFIEGTAEKLSSVPSDGAAAPTSTSAAASAADLRPAPADGTPVSASVDFGKQQADGRGKAASAPSNTLAFQQLSLTFKHGASSAWLAVDLHKPDPRSIVTDVQELKLSWLAVQCGTVWTCQRARTRCGRQHTSRPEALPSCTYSM